MERLFGDTGQLIQQNPWLAVLAVFVGGMTTASNPCVLAMIPLMMSVVAGYKETTGLKKALIFSLFFVFGLSITFTILGLISALMGSMFGDVGRFWKYLIAAVCLAMGLNLLGLFKINFRRPEYLRVRRSGTIGAFLLGLLFGVVSTPCAVPILAVLLTFVASQGNVIYGGVLLLVYALGHSVLVLIAGTSMGAAKRMIESRGLRRANMILQRASGVIIILIGAYFVFRY